MNRYWGWYTLGGQLDVARQKLEAELEYLRREKRRQITERISESKEIGGFGDNADLDDAGRCARLLEALRGVEEARRTARFRCVIALVEPDGREAAVEGVVEGRIAEAPRGRGGFGYDPIFYYPPLGRTFAELTAAEKAAVSHRGRAARAARRLLTGCYTRDAG